MMRRWWKEGWWKRWKEGGMVEGMMVNEPLITLQEYLEITQYYIYIENMHLSPAQAVMKVNHRQNIFIII